MLALLSVAALAGYLPAQVLEPGNCGYLYQPAYCLDCKLRGPAAPYVPEAGDIMLCTDFNWFWTIGHNLAGAGHPHHSGIVVPMPDGQLGVLEAGPHDQTFIGLGPAVEHLASYEPNGPVWIRKRRVPLTCDESARMMEFAQIQKGKRFAVWRLCAQVTPLRSRGNFRTQWLGGPHGPDRWSYFCSELVMETCVYTGLLDPARTRPAATYPHDIFMDHSNNKVLNQWLKLYPCWDPPARWTSCLKDQ